jgi:hypothetical protein
MIGAYAAHARPLLLVLSVLFTVLFAVPMIVGPLAWGRAMRFRIPSETDLAVYYGRCLGSIALVLSALMLRAALTGVAIVFVFEVGLAFSILMVFVHAYGAVKRIQPITETVETLAWALVVVLYALCFPVTTG